METTSLAPGLQRGWDGPEIVDRLRENFPDAIVDTHSFREERTVVVDRDKVFEVLAFLRDDASCRFDYCTDVTGVHWPARDLPYEVVYTLYSFERKRYLRVKAALPDPPSVRSAVSLWPGANWLERECYDMFGIEFERHPNMRRILMTDDFDNYPLRKDYPLKC